MVSNEQKAHDLTVALVAATAKENTAKEYVALYNALISEVKECIESSIDRKAEPIDRSNLRL